MKNIVLAILAVLLLIVVLQNTQTVETKLLWMSFRMPRALLLFITLLMGTILGLLIGERSKRRTQAAQDQATQDQAPTA